jgi:hypothetical protein
MKEYSINTYEEAVSVIKEIGLLPLAPLIPEFPSLGSITSKESWHSETEFDPWIWRTNFSADGIAAYGKFIKKKSVLISRELLPYVLTVLGKNQTMNERYLNGNISREAFNLYTLISQEEGIDTRVLREKAGMKEKEKKKIFDNALLELQGTMDIVVSGIKEKQDLFGEKNGWSSTSFETIKNWTSKNKIDTDINKDFAKKVLVTHFAEICSPVSMKKMEKIFLL